MRANSAGLRIPGTPETQPALKPGFPGNSADGVAIGSGVLIVLSYIYVFEQSKCIVCQDSRGAVERNQIRRERSLVDAHETNREPWTLLSRKAGLEEANHALLLFTHAEQKDLGGLVLASHRDLVAWNQRNAAPGQERCAEESDRWRRYSAARAFPPKSGNSARMSQEQRGLLPYLSQQLVQIVWCRSALARLELLRAGNIVQQAIVGVVE